MNDADSCRCDDMAARILRFCEALLLPVWVFNPAQTAPVWMTGYYTLTYALIYIALMLCLYSGAIYLSNTFRSHKD